MFSSPGLEKTYHPVVHKRERMPDGSQKFVITFIERLPEEDIKPAGNLGAVYILMIITARFRWGVLLKYLSQLEKLSAGRPKPEQINQCLEGVRFELQKIESQARLLGFFERDAWISAFARDERKQIKEILNDWTRVRKELMEKMDSRDVGGVINILRKLAAVNKSFLLLSAKRCHELLNEI